MHNQPESQIIAESTASLRIDSATALSTLHSPVYPAPFATEAAAMPTLGLGDSLAIMGAPTWPELPWWRRISPSTFFVLLSAALAIFFLLHELILAGKLGFPTDESWIEQVYAKNFFPHISFEFNKGEPSAGPTSPFWVVLLSLGVNLFHDPILPAKLLGTIFLFLTGYYTFRLLRAVELDYGASLLAGVLATTSAWLGWAELSGLESTLSAALVVGAMWWQFARPRSQSHWLQSFITGAIFGLATLTRPEVAAVFLIVLVDDLVRGFRKRYQETSQHSSAGFMLLAFAIVVIPVALTSYTESGSFVPLTFHTGLGSNSALRLLRHGDIGGVTAQLIQSFAGIWSMITSVYAAENPLWLVTIPIALLVRRRSHFRRREAIDHLFSLTSIIVLLFPYLHALILGRNDAFGAADRQVHFILPIYTIAGVLSLYTLARSMVSRPVSGKTMLVCIAGITVLTGCLVIALLPVSSATAPSIVLTCLAVFIAASLLLILAFRQARLEWKKKPEAEFVSEEERDQLHIMDGRSEHESNIPAHAVRILRGAAMIALAWDIVQLPLAAHRFAQDVRSTNQDLAFARSISYVTQSWDVIATNKIGVVSWGSDRTVFDLGGHLSGLTTSNELAFGEAEGLRKTIGNVKPEYVALFGDRYRDFVDASMKAGALRPILLIQSQQSSAQLLKVNTAQPR